MPDRGVDEYLLAAQVGKLLHVSPKTIARWAKDGKLPFVRTLGGHRRYSAATIQELAQRLEVAPSLSIDEVLGQADGTSR